MSAMTFLKGIYRAVWAMTHSCPGWEMNLAMIQFRESDLPRAVQSGMLPKETLEYATEVIELKIEEKAVAKTRYQWAQFNSPESKFPFPLFPYRSYDTNRTKGVIIHLALLDLVALNKERPELSLHELYSIIQNKYWK
jgi:hypothetical protein